MTLAANSGRFPRPFAPAYPRLLIGGGCTLAALVAALVTYREWVDGPLAPFLMVLLLAATGALLASAWGELHRASLWGTVALALLAMLPGWAVHSARMLERQMPLQREWDGRSDFQSVFRPELRDGATLQPEQRGVALRAPASSVGYLEIRLPRAEWTTWRLPRALVAPEHPRVAEQLRWSGWVALERSYFTLVETEGLLVQITTWGLTVSHRPGDGQPTQTDVPFAPAGNPAAGLPADRILRGPDASGLPQELTLRRAWGRLSLTAGQRELWSAPASRAWRTLRLGETKPDREHGGTLRLVSLQYTRFIT